LKTTIENIESQINDATSSLIDMARNSCWNSISNNTSYIISEIKDDGKNFEQQRIERNKVNNKKEPKSLQKIISELKMIFEDLYDINLYIFRSEKTKTIIEIQYYPKSSLESGFYKTVKNNSPMLHCKVSIPVYTDMNKEQKYDVNWELGGIRYEWNLFWYRLKFNWKYRNRSKKMNLK